MTATVTASPLGVLVAFGAGIISFLSPCVLPLVPGYVSMVSGLSAAELERAPGSAGVPLGRLVRDIALFVAGFTLVFVALGAAASGIGHLLGAHKRELTEASGAVVIALGAVLLVASAPQALWVRVGAGPRALAARVLGERRLPVQADACAAPVLGMAFGFAWTPCIGPVLGAVTALAASKGTLAGGVILLFAYSLGLGVPFVVTGLAFGRLTTLFARARRGMGVVQMFGGLVLIVFGALLVSDQLGWLASEMQQLMRHIGLGRLTT